MDGSRKQRWPTILRIIVHLPCRVQEYFADAHRARRLGERATDNISLTRLPDSTGQLNRSISPVADDHDERVDVGKHVCLARIRRLILKTVLHVVNVTHGGFGGASVKFPYRENVAQSYMP